MLNALINETITSLVLASKLSTLVVNKFQYEIGVAESYFITSLISFNIGVEIGQLLVISVCFVSIGFWFGQKKWYRSYLTNPLSAMIAIVGLFWFIERVGFLI